VSRDGSISRMSRQYISNASLVHCKLAKITVRIFQNCVRNVRMQHIIIKSLKKLSEAQVS